AVFRDQTFWISLQHTFVFVIASVMLETLLGLGLALLAKEPTRASRATRVLLLLPWAIPPVANGLVWSFIFDSKYGYLNVALHRLGFIDEFVRWLGDPSLAMLAVITAYVWRTTPFTALLLYAALRGIPDELYDAAEVDGAGAWQRFRAITLPLLVPTLTVALVLRTTFAFMVFDEIFALTQGGPGNATWVAGWYVYRHAFQPPFEIGIAAASAYVLAMIIAVFAFLYIWLARRAPGAEW
ncbi:MAG: carbohydrate ABC transporter permease, partial [Thermomicrobiales bacterium]